MKITPRDAVAIIRHLEPFAAAAGFHTALTGSVLYKGESEKDVDVIIYQHDHAEEVNDDRVYRLLVDAGFFIKKKHEPDDTPYNLRQVWQTDFKGTRVDIFLFIHGKH